MYDEQKVIEVLGVSDLGKEEQQQIVLEASRRIGAAALDPLSDELIAEYESIINGESKVIQTWLTANVPDYKETAVYKEVAAGYHDDPERNDPSKIYANLAWIQKNVPDLDRIIESTLAEYKQELSA